MVMPPQLPFALLPAHDAGYRDYHAHPAPAATAPDTKDASAKPKRRKQTKTWQRDTRGLMLPVEISNELQAELGIPGRYVTRPQLNRYAWQYFKKHSLQNPQNQREILSNAPLRALTGVPSFNGFGFQSVAKSHIRAVPLDQVLSGVAPSV